MDIIRFTIFTCIGMLKDPCNCVYLYICTDLADQGPSLSQYIYMLLAVFSINQTGLKESNICTIKDLFERTNSNIIHSFWPCSLSTMSVPFTCNESISVVLLLMKGENRKKNQVTWDKTEKLFIPMIYLYHNFRLRLEIMCKQLLIW